MGCAASTERNGEWRDTTIQSLRELQGVLRWSGVRSTNLIIGVDFTRSNMWNGKQSFGGRCLHFIDPEGLILNPYQVVINIVCRTLRSRKSTRPIHVFGFGDARTADRCVFTLLPDGSPCRGVDHVLKQYKEVAPELVLGGPTNFAPIIYQAIRQAKETGVCSILVIIADGQVTNEKETSQAIVEASKHSLSIIVVGVGDGPWEDMDHYNDILPKRAFDNYRFVNLNQVMSGNPDQPAIGFATAALAHIPDQLADIRRLGLLHPSDCEKKQA
ncbi:uncharacterized protein IUM83_01384 [Phytophthora cinnamomi]|uniref:uncharacterized protein n=1 Tax=Phytophthora cinnamomi TaxID=4785 RepID=UPI00355ACCC9|nr:hypothetical protein IUM83_01384 [Phytophthora cinnamomi]